MDSIPETVAMVTVASSLTGNLLGDFLLNTETEQ